MKKKNIKTELLLLLLIALLTSCSKYSRDVLTSLEQAGDNRKELEYVLEYYQKGDKEKYKAVCYLISNMKYHGNTTSLQIDTAHLSYFTKIDSIFYELFGDMSAKEALSFKSTQYDSLRNELANQYSHLPRLIRNSVFQSDLTNVDANFLIDNIESAFHVWKTSPYAKGIDYEVFLETILPYRTTDEPILYKRSELTKMFGPKVLSDDVEDVYSCIEKYMVYVDRCRWLNHFTIPTEHVGVYDLLLRKFKNDCHNISSWTTNLFRAWGIPTVYEYTVKWQDRDKSHFWCASPDSTGFFLPYTPPDNNIKEDWASDLKYAGKVYRKTFGANANTPYFLKANSEYTPEELSSPLLSDQTCRYHQSVTLRLPFTASTGNQLAYLCFFSNNENGLTPVGWGKIDSKKQEIIYEQVPVNVLFFPAYYEGDDMMPFGAPFIIHSNDSISDADMGTFYQKDKSKTPDISIIHGKIHFNNHTEAGYRLKYMAIKSEVNNKQNMILLRKYPGKRSLKASQSKLQGALILGSNQESKGFDTLYVVNQVPDPYLQEIKLQNNKKYRFYKWVSKEPLNLAHVEFLGPITNSHERKKPTALPIFSKTQAEEKTLDIHKYVGTPLKTGRSPEHAFDDNMETYVGSTQVGMDFGKAIQITEVRFAPRNANNGIVPGDLYTLWYYDGKWIFHSEIIAEKNYLEFEDVPANTIYWLKNLSHGREELPFYYKDAKQYFINTDKYLIFN